VKAKKPDFLEFNDGRLDLYETDENDELIVDSLRAYRFGNRTVGVKRYYAARTNDIELDMLIHIHFNADVTADMAAVIDGTRYKIVQVQHLKNTKPRCTVLSLAQRGLYRGDAYEPC
jgi:SPP1 family predicted phage head-tail adaptor